jgi:hypothetical protein
MDIEQVALTEIPKDGGGAASHTLDALMLKVGVRGKRAD